MTTIKFERSGGLLGQNVEASLELASLPASEANQLMQLIQQAKFFSLPENLVGAATSDEFVYKVTVEAGAIRHCVQTSDTRAPEALRPLLSVLSALAMER